jgi:hypothetical protein
MLENEFLQVRVSYSIGKVFGTQNAFDVQYIKPCALCDAFMSTLMHEHLY